MFLSKISKLLAGAIAMAKGLGGLPMFHDVAAIRMPTHMVRARIKDSNRAAREKDGLPHGTSGAKLIRRAAEGRITKFA